MEMNFDSAKTRTSAFLLSVGSKVKRNSKTYHYRRCGLRRQVIRGDHH
jgi:hypothetical protein